MHDVWPYQGSNQDACRTTQDIAGEFDDQSHTDSAFTTLSNRICPCNVRNYLSMDQFDRDCPQERNNLTQQSTRVTPFRWKPSPSTLVNYQESHCQTCGPSGSQMGRAGSNNSFRGWTRRMASVCQKVSFFLDLRQPGILMGMGPDSAAMGNAMAHGDG